MKKVDYEHFSRFLMPHSLKARGEDLYFCVKQTKMEENKYVHDLYRIRDGKVQRLSALGDLGRYELTEDGIVFAAARTEEEKKKAESGEPVTFFYQLPYDGGEAVPFMTVPYSVEKLIPAGKDRYFIAISENPLLTAALKEHDGDMQKAAAALKEEADYHVVDEIPFYLNNVGYINGIRTRIMLLENGEYKPVLAEEKENYGILSAVNGKICYTVTDTSTGKMPLYNRLFVLDEATLEKTEICFDRPCEFYCAWALDDGRYAMILNIGDQHGLNQNPYFYLYDNGSFTEVYGEGLLSFANSVGSDIKAEGRTDGMDLPVKDGALYTLDTVWNHTAITKIGLADGSVERLTDNGMNITSFDFYKDGFAFIALCGNGGQEVYTLSESGEIVRLTDFNMALCEEYEYSEPIRMTFKDAEGMEIEGWVLKPADYDAGKKYPAILDIHGGPKTVFGSCYFHEMQMWASMGYFVFYCNPVGGDGRGDEFLDIFGHYGDQDYRDIMQFTDEVLKQYPAIDTARVGVTGGSYGGFMTNWIIGHTDRFKAAASQRSIANWISFHNTSDIGYYFAPDQIGGDPWEDTAKLWSMSPLKYADKVTTPTLFIHSDEDYRCPLSEGMQMFTALRDHNVEARMCIFKGENHELSRSGKPKHRVRRLKEITAWFEKYLKEA